MVKMTTQKSNKLEHNRRCKGSSPDARRDRERLKKLNAAHDRGTIPPRHQTCAPQGTSGKTVRKHFEEIEPLLTNYARLNPDVSVITGITDMTRLTMLNKIVTMNGGTRALGLYLERTERALALVAGLNGSEVDDIHQFRVAETSDECITLIVGKRLTKRPDFWFNKAWGYLGKKTDLRDYRFLVEAEDGSNKVSFDLDLYALSQVLRNPDVLVLSHHSMFGPSYVKPDAEAGFLLEHIRKLQNKEIRFRKYLPHRFRGNGGLAEVESPFTESLTSMGIERTEKGSLVDIKLGITAKEARALRHLIEITRKGYSEVHSGKLGIRGTNTFLGKSITNTLLTPVAQAMGELTGKVAVRPVAGGYLRYWVDLPPNESTVRAIREAIQMKAPKRRSSAYLQLLSDPVISILDAENVDVSDVRCLFILQSMGKKNYEPWVLDAADSILNIIENIDPDVQDEIYDSLASSGRAVSEMDIRYMKLIRRICEERRTIRDTEDLVWVLRKDKGLASDISANQGDVKNLENWLFDFSAERFKKIFLLLARRIQEEMREYSRGISITV